MISDGTKVTGKEPEERKADFIRGSMCIEIGRNLGGCAFRTRAITRILCSIFRERNDRAYFLTLLAAVGRHADFNVHAEMDSNVSLATRMWGIRVTAIRNCESFGRVIFAKLSVGNIFPISPLFVPFFGRAFYRR